MVQSYFGLTHNLSQVLNFHLEFENQSRSRATILGLEQPPYQQWNIQLIDQIIFCLHYLQLA